MTVLKKIGFGFLWLLGMSPSAVDATDHRHLQQATESHRTSLSPRLASLERLESEARLNANPKTPGLGEGLFEMTPQIGFMGGSTLVGFKASMLYYGFSLELSADQVMGRYATLFPLTGNLVFNLAHARRVVPYGIVGGGLFLVKSENTVGDRVLSSLGINVGGGLRYYLNSRIGIRFETKQYFTEIHNKNENHPELLIYQSSSLGVIIAFI
jgi:hypothetical protein